MTDQALFSQDTTLNGSHPVETTDRGMVTRSKGKRKRDPVDKKQGEGGAQKFKTEGPSEATAAGDDADTEVECGPPEWTKRLKTQACEDLLRAIKRFHRDLDTKSSKFVTPGDRLIAWRMWHDAGLCDQGVDLPCESCMEECEWCSKEVHMRSLITVRTLKAPVDAKYCASCVKELRERLNALAG